MLVTFVSVLVIPVQYAVMLGVALAVVQHVYSASLDARVVVLTPGHGGLYAEGPAPEVLPSEAVTVLDIYGSVFYAGADVIAGLLPTAHGAFRPAVILRLRGRTDVGSTFLGVLDRYRREVEASQGMLMLAGVSPQLRQQLQRTGLIRTLGDDRVFDAQPTLTESLGVAIATAEAWLCEEQAEGTPSA
jgi:SulP family sulfate permease